MSQRDTRTQLLDAAERVLLQHGVSGLSVRNVTTAAGMNVGAVNYTFGGKDGLLYALLERSMSPLAAERIRRLDEVTASGEYTVEDLVRAYTVPLLGMEPHVAPLFIELLVKPRLEGNDRLLQAGREVLRPGIERLVDALVTALPHQPRETLALRIRLLFAAAALYLHEEIPSEPDRQRMIDELIVVTAAALSAPDLKHATSASAARR